MSLTDCTDAPLSDRPQLTLAVEEYRDYVRALADEDEVYGWAVGTLAGIADTITMTGRVTDGQRQAVRNIVSGAEEGSRTRERNRSSRRYEGWSR